MCGIAGIAGQQRVNRQAVETMMNLMVHRGPDDSGLWTSENKHVVFGHRRLAIIDLTAAGHQPMNAGAKNFITCAKP